MNDRELLEKIKKDLENAVENVVSDFTNKLGSLLLSIISEKIKLTERFIDTEAELLEEFTARNFAEMRSNELLELMLRIEKLITNSIEYLNQVRDDIKLLKKEDIPVSTSSLNVLTPQQREILRKKLLQEISIIQEGKDEEKSTDTDNKENNQINS